MGRKKHKNRNAQAPSPPAVPPSARTYPKKKVLVIPRTGIMGWIVAEKMSTDASFVDPAAKIVRAAVGPEWRQDVSSAGTTPAAELERQGGHLLLGIHPEEQTIFDGLSDREILVHPEILGLAGLPALLAGDASARDPQYGTFPGTLSETVFALWDLAEGGTIPASEAEAACRFLARAALARFKAGNAVPADMNALQLRAFARQPGTPWLHERAFARAGLHLHQLRKAAARDWRLGRGRIIPVATPQGTIRIAVCHSPSPFLADWLFQTEAPNAVLRLEDGGFFCRADKNSGITLHRAVAAWRRAALDRPPTKEEEDALESHGRPFGTPIDFWRDDLTAGNKMLANPHLPQVDIDPAQIVELLTVALANPA